MAITSLLLLAPLVPASAGDAPIDWILMEATFPVEGTSYRIWFGVSGQAGPGETFVGRGYDLGFTRDVTVSSYRGSQGGEPEDSLVATAGPVREEITFTQAADGRLGVGAALHVFTAPSPSVTVRAIVFVPGADIETWFASIMANGQVYPAKVTTGSGSTLVRITDAGLGVAARLPDAHGGQTWGINRVTVSPEVGIIGALAGYECVDGEVCKSSYRGPDGQEGDWEQHWSANGQSWAGGSRPSFSGPSGAWEMRWEGRSNSDAIAAYAPVGDLWRDW